MKSVRVALGAAMVVCALSGVAGADTIDFEDLPRETYVTDQYVSRGVLFVPDGTSQHLSLIGDFILEDHGIADMGSSPSQALIVGAGGNALNAVFVDPVTGLASAVDSFSVRVGDGDAATEDFRVTAFDSLGGVLFQQSYLTLGGTIDGGVTVSLATADIARVEFRHLTTGSGFNIDDLTFNHAAPGPVVPTPSAAWGGLALLGGLAVVRVRQMATVS